MTDRQYLRLQFTFKYIHYKLLYKICLMSSLIRYIGFTFFTPLIPLNRALFLEWLGYLKITEHSFDDLFSDPFFRGIVFELFLLCAPFRMRRKRNHKIKYA